MTRKLNDREKIGFEREKHDKEIQRERKNNEKEIKIEKEKTERYTIGAQKELYLESMRPRIVAEQTKVQDGWISDETNTERIYRAPFQEHGWEQPDLYTYGDEKNMKYTYNQHQKTGHLHQQKFDDEL